LLYVNDVIRGKLMESEKPSKQAMNEVQGHVADIDGGAAGGLLTTAGELPSPCHIWSTNQSLVTPHSRSHERKTSFYGTGTI
jgi:hypothetical protein